MEKVIVLAIFALAVFLLGMVVNEVLRQMAENAGKLDLPEQKKKDKRKEDYV